ncbi:MAG: NAD(P)/FAD-dependent oxidoreductase [Sulfolobales archaeon]|nr:NAD(P)/FAD-dependent oxidoreductase [Sulfolobales archaeon]
MSSEEFDALVIGGGPAGYWASLIASIRGLKVALVEEGRVGGTCLNYGCVPLVTLMNYLSTVDLIRKLSSEGSGIFVKDLEVDIGKVFEYVEKNVTTPISESMRKTLEDLDVRIISGRAALINERTAKVGDKVIGFKRAVIASGLSWKSLEGALPCVEFTRIREKPSKVLVVGGNPFGLSIASLFSMLGCEVLVVEGSTNVLEGFDTEVSEYLLMMLREKNIEVMLNTKVVKVVLSGDGKKVRLSTPEGELHLSVDVVFDAVSYSPRLDSLGGVKVDLEKGYIRVDERLRTSVGNIYAAGDVTGTSQYANVAIVQGIVAGENISGNDLRINLKLLPRYLFTYPEAFSVGLTESEARKAGYVVSVARQSLASNPILRSVGSAGMVKVVVDANYGGILGVQAVGHGITELINEGILMVALESTCGSIINTYLAHPTVGEVLRDSLIQVYRP